MFTGTYTLLAYQAVFNQYAVDATCHLCRTEPEDRTHFLLVCSALQHVRDRFIPSLLHYIPGLCGGNPDDLLQPLVDGSIVQDSKFEKLARNFTFAMHKARTFHLNLQKAPNHGGV